MTDIQAGPALMFVIAVSTDATRCVPFAAKTAAASISTEAAIRDVMGSGFDLSPLGGRFVSAGRTLTFEHCSLTESNVDRIDVLRRNMH